MSGKIVGISLLFTTAAAAMSAQESVRERVHQNQCTFRKPRPAHSSGVMTTEEGGSKAQPNQQVHSSPSSPQPFAA